MVLITAIQRRRRLKGKAETRPSRYLEEIPKYLISMRDMAAEHTEAERSAMFCRIGAMFGGGEERVSR